MAANCVSEKTMLCSFACVLSASYYHLGARRRDDHVGQREDDPERVGGRWCLRLLELDRVLELLGVLRREGRGSADVHDGLGEVELLHEGAERCRGEQGAQRESLRHLERLGHLELLLADAAALEEDLDGRFEGAVAADELGGGHDMLTASVKLTSDAVVLKLACAPSLPLAPRRERRPPRRVRRTKCARSGSELDLSGTFRHGSGSPRVRYS